MGRETLTQKVVGTITERIENGSLPQGAKLGSVRQAAKAMGASVSTIVEAYGRLVAEGAIVSRPGSGFYVAQSARPIAVSRTGPKLDRAVDPFWVSRQSLEGIDDGPKPGCGWLPGQWLPQAALRRALRALSKEDGAALADYGTPLGHAPLRQVIARRLAEKGVEAAPDQIVLTESGTQSIDIVCRMVLAPGDTVLVDDPCYFNFQALLRAHRAKIVGVPYRGDGPDVEAFAQVLAAERPKLYITNSAIHNPTGAVLSPSVAHRVLRLAEQFGLTIVEDDIFTDFEMVPAPRLAALDGFENVIEIGSFSKSLSASARCGFVVARREWVEGLIDMKIATSFGGPSLSAELVHRVLTDSGYRKHMEEVRQRLGRAMTVVQARLASMGIEPVVRPPAGMFLWCRLPDGIDAAELARRALAEGVVLAPGNVFSVSQTAPDCMRFNVSQCDRQVLDTIERTISVLRR